VVGRSGVDNGRAGAGRVVGRSGVDNGRAGAGRVVGRSGVDKGAGRVVGRSGVDNGRAGGGRVECGVEDGVGRAEGAAAWVVVGPVEAFLPKNTLARFFWYPDLAFFLPDIVQSTVFQFFHAQYTLF
jgi:hypothetical protein